MNSPFSNLVFDFGKIVGPKQSASANFEELVFQLLALEVGAKVIDGAGGDLGVDCYIGTFRGEITVFQIKYLLGRLQDSQRQQIKKSFATAAKFHQLRRWVLCTPTNPTPKEIEWLNSLFPNADWWGASKFRSLLAKYPKVAGQFFQEEVLSARIRLVEQQIEDLRHELIFALPPDIASHPKDADRYLLCAENACHAALTWIRSLREGNKQPWVGVDFSELYAYLRTDASLLVKRPLLNFCLADSPWPIILPVGTVYEIGSFVRRSPYRVGVDWEEFLMNLRRSDEAKAFVSGFRHSPGSSRTIETYRAFVSRMHITEVEDGAEATRLAGSLISKKLSAAPKEFRSFSDSLFNAARSYLSALRPAKSEANAADAANIAFLTNAGREFQAPTLMLTSDQRYKDVARGLSRFGDMHSVDSCNSTKALTPSQFALTLIAMQNYAGSAEANLEGALTRISSLRRIVHEYSISSGLRTERLADLRSFAETYRTLFDPVDEMIESGFKGVAHIPEARDHYELLRGDAEQIWEFRRFWDRISKDYQTIISVLQEEHGYEDIAGQIKKLDSGKTSPPLLTESSTDATTSAATKNLLMPSESFWANQHQLIMTTSNPNSPGTGGGSVAIRGFLVQTLVALLEVAKPEFSFTEITLEPAVGDDQFDFLWKNKDASYATQVKSTVNSFTKADVEKWADKLRKVRTDEICTLMLVGHIPPTLVGLNTIDGVSIETKNLHLGDLVEQAAQRLAKFLESERMPAGTALQREMVVHALTSRLEHLATKSEPLSRESFLGLLRQWINSAPRGYAQVDLSHFNVLKYAPTELVGRSDESAILDQAWLRVIREEKPRAHVLTFVALGGEGKTSLVAKWAAELASQDWPGCDAAFAWSFYSQGTREQHAASSDLFLKQALNFFGDDADKQFAASSAGAFAKGHRLAHLVGQRRSLLILDGLEPLQYSPTSPTSGELKDQGIAALLKGLAANSRGLCLVTTRYSLPDLRAFWQTTAPEIALLRLSTATGVHMLQKLGARKESGSQTEFERLVEDFKGHALTLNLLGTFLRDAHAGDIRKRDLVKLADSDAEEQGGHAFRVMDAYVKSLESEGERGKRALAVLRLLGLFDRPATADCLGVLWRTPAIAGLTELLIEMSEAQRNLVLKRLEDAKLLTVNREASGALVSLDAHPLLREYFARHLRTQQPGAWRAAHRRLYEHLCTNTKEGDQPTLEDLQALYQAVAHGCQAGLHQEAYNNVYRDRIQRGNEYYCVRILGAMGSDLGAVACFFDEPWKRPNPAMSKPNQALLFSQSAFYLRALGRLTEALDPMQAALEMGIKQQNWEAAATRAGNLSELELTLGEVLRAVENTRQSLAYADQSGDISAQYRQRSKLANALHQAGHWDEAEALFREAEQMQAESDGTYPLLFSQRGFLYCDLLLADIERAAWHSILGLKTENLKLEILTAISQRATQTLKIGVRDQILLEIALDYLTLGRVALYAGILRKSAVQSAKVQVEKAVDGLRRAGTQDMLPRGLLTRAWLRFLMDARTGHESAQEDLDEAWEIAERGPMKLHMADIHLYRARLFFREEKYPWESPDADLAAAEKLINECGYHRRDEELADAKRAILGT